MCLYIGNKEGHIAKKDIKCYKLLRKSGKDYITPSRGWKIEFDIELVPDQKEPQINNRGYKYSLEGGAIHAFLDTRDNGYGSEGEIFEAIIPQGTRFWLQDDLKQIAAQKIIITRTIAPRKVCVDYLDFLYIAADVRLSDGKREFASEKLNPKTVIGIYSGNKIVATEVIAKKFCENERLKSTEGIKLCERGDDARADKNGYQNTQNLRKISQELPALKHCLEYETPGTSKGDWYLPAEGELMETFLNLESINLTLKILGKEIIPYVWFWSSTMYSDQYAWNCCSSGLWNRWGYDGIWYGSYVLPFLEPLMKITDGLVGRKG